MFKAATKLTGRVVLFSAYAAGFVLLSVGFVIAFILAIVRLVIGFAIADIRGDDEYEADALAKKRFYVTFDGFERAARAMAYAPIVSKGSRSWKF